LSGAGWNDGQNKRETTVAWRGTSCARATHTTSVSASQGTEAEDRGEEGQERGTYGDLLVHDLVDAARVLQVLEHDVAPLERLLAEPRLERLDVLDLREVGVTRRARQRCGSAREMRQRAGRGLDTEMEERTSASRA